MELECCPFCGEKAMISRTLHKADYYRGKDGTLKSDDGWETYLVRCTKCFVRTKEFGTEPEAVNAWNTRLMMGPFPT